MFKLTLNVFLTVSIALAAVHAQPSTQTNFKTANAETLGWAALPLLGFVVDGAHALRPLVGIAGAASVGSALNLGFEVSQAQIPPGHSYMVVTTGENDWPLWIQVRAGTMAIRPLRPNRRVECFEFDTPQNFRDGLLSRRCVPEAVRLDASAKIDRVALSGTGSAAALLSESTGRIYVFNNMPDSPALVREFEAGGLGPVS